MSAFEKRKRRKHNVVDLRKAVVAKDNSDWVKYFARIRGVCPWSYKLMDSILVWENSIKCLNTIAVLFPATKFEAFVYTYKDLSPSQLEKLADKITDVFATT